MQRVAFFGINPFSRNFYPGVLPFSDGMPQSAGTSIEALLETYAHTGNKGNMMHGEAPAKILGVDRARSAFVSIGGLLAAGWSVDRVAELLSQQFDLVVFSTANIIRKGTRHEGTAELLERLTCAFMVLGVGVQDGLAARLDALDPSLVRLLEVCNRKARVFGVRGEITRRWLQDAGLGNARALGCPSLFVYPNNTLAIQPPRAWPGLRALTGGYIATRSPRSTALIGLFRGVGDVHYVMQDEVPEMHSRGVFEGARELYDDATGELDFSVMDHMLSQEHDERLPFRSYRWFQSPASWRMFASTFDVCISDRLHGAVAALQTGVPTVLIVADDRVREVAELLAIPSVSVDEIASTTFADVVATRLDRHAVEAFKANYRTAFARFAGEMAEVGVPLVAAPAAGAPAAGAPVKLPRRPLPKRSASVVRRWLRSI